MSKQKLVDEIKLQLSYAQADQGEAVAATISLLEGLLDTANEVTNRFEGIELLYDYEERAGVICPARTVAIIREVVGDEELFGVGVSFCSKSDFPNRSKGRRIAIARAKGAIAKGSMLHSGIHHCTEDVIASTKLIGQCANYDDMMLVISDFGFSLEFTTRIGNALTYIMEKHVAEEEAVS